MESLVGHILTQYLGDYFVNFSSDKFSMSLLSGVISVNDLIFRTEINDRLSFPVKLKYGQLGHLEIKLQSYTNIAKGMQCKISEVFLCLEMLEMENWSKESVISKYQELKKFTIEGFEKQLGIVHGEFEKTKEEVSSETLQAILANLKIEVEKVYIRFEDETLGFSMGYLLPKIDALSTNSDFQEALEHITDVAVLFKKLKVDDISAFINTGAKFKPLHELLQLSAPNIHSYMKGLTEAKIKTLCASVKMLLRSTFKDSENRLLLHSPDQEESKPAPKLASAKTLINNTYQVQANEAATIHNQKDSGQSTRLGKLLGAKPSPKNVQPQTSNQEGTQSKGLLKTSNDYIFLDNKFSIECDLKYVQDYFKACDQARQNGQTFNEPTTEINLTLGGVKPAVATNDENDGSSKQPQKAIKYIISEEQLYVSLHISTFLTAYQNFSQGVLQNHISLQSSQGRLKHLVPEYRDQYTEYLTYKTDNIKDRDYQKKLSLLSESLAETEKLLSIEIIVKLRYFTANWFYGERKVESQYQAELQSINRPLSSGFGLGLFTDRAAKSDNAGAKKTPDQMRHQLKMNRQQTLRELKQANLEKLNKMSRGEDIDDADDEKIAMLSQSSLGQVTEVEDQAALSGDMNWFKMKYEVPKLQIEVHPKVGAQAGASQKRGNQAKGQKQQNGDGREIRDRPKLGTISLEGLKFEMETKSASDSSIMRLNMDGLSIYDPNVLGEIREANVGLDLSNSPPSAYVLRTRPRDLKREKNDATHIEAMRMSSRMMTTGQDDADMLKKCSGKLLSLVIETVQMEDYKRLKQLSSPDDLQNNLDTISESQGALSERLDNIEDLDSNNSGFDQSKSQDQIQEASGDKEDGEDDDKHDDTSRRSKASQSKASQSQAAKEYHTNIDFKVTGDITLFSNFFFIKKALRLITGIAKDMEHKRTMLTRNISKPEILDNIIGGFDYLEKLRQAAYARMEEIRQDQLRRQSTMVNETSMLFKQEEIISPTDIMVYINKPKIVFDEYLLGMPVLDERRPAIFLLDMGSWLFQTKAYPKSLEKLTEFCMNGGMDEQTKFTKEEWLQSGTYESIDMKFIDLSLTYSPYSSSVLLAKRNKKLVPVFKELNLGFQMMSLLKQQGPVSIPESVMNILFDELKLYFDRHIFCQILKIQAFMSYGTWLDDMKEMSEALARAHDFSQARENTKRLSRKKKNKPQIDVFSAGTQSQISNVSKNQGAKSQISLSQSSLMQPPKSQHGIESQITGISQPNSGRNDENSFNTDSDESAYDDVEDTVRAQDDVVGTGMRIKLIFNRLSLVVQEVSWHPKREPTVTQRASGVSGLFGNAFATVGSMISNELSKDYEIKKNFEIQVQSLKIACNFPEIKPGKKTYIMDVLVFLDKVKVADLANSHWQFKNLLIYEKDEPEVVEQPQQAEAQESERSPKASSRKDKGSSFRRPSKLVEIFGIEKMTKGMSVDNQAMQKKVHSDLGRISPSPISQARSKSPRFISKSHESDKAKKVMKRSLSFDQAAHKEVKARKKLQALTFEPFDNFLGIKRFQKGKDQFAIRMKSVTITKRVKALDKHGLEHEESYTESNKEINVGKLKVVAIYDLVERLLQWNWNLLFDLTNMDVEFHEHIKFQAQQEKLRSGTGNLSSRRQPNASIDNQNARTNMPVSQDQRRPTISQELRRKSYFADPAAAIALTKEWINRELSFSVSHDDDDSADSNKSLKDILKIVREFWADETLLQMAEIVIMVPSDLADPSVSALNISVGMDLTMTYSMDTKVVYDITNELAPINVEQELQKSDWVQRIQLKSLKLFMSGMLPQETWLCEASFGGGGAASRNRRSQQTRRQITKKNKRDQLNGRTKTLIHGKTKKDRIEDLLHAVSFDFEMIWKTIDNSAILNELIRPHERKTIHTSHLLRDPGYEWGRDVLGGADVGDKEYKSLGYSIMRTTFHDELRLTIRMKELRAFQNLLQVTLFYNNRIAYLDSIPLPEFKKAQDRAVGARSFLVQSEIGLKKVQSQNLTIATEPQLIAMNNPLLQVQSQLNPIPRAMISPESVMSIKSEGNMQELPNTVVKPMGTLKSQVRVNENRSTMMNFNQEREGSFDNVPDVSGSKSDIFSYPEEQQQQQAEQESDIHNLADNPAEHPLRLGAAPAHEEADEQSVDQIVALHCRKQEQMSKSQLMHMESMHMDKEKTVIWALMEVQFNKGLVVAIDDEFTADYDEFVLGLVAKEFSMVQSYLYSDVFNKFRQHQQFEKDRDLMIKQLVRWWDPESGEQYPIKSSLVTYDQGINLDFKVIYFNKSTFCLEPLIEPYQLKVSMMQETPLSQLEQCISSPVMMNINFTYGCIVSIGDTLAFIRKEELDMATFLAEKQKEESLKQEQALFGKTLTRRSNTQKRSGLTEKSSSVFNVKKTGGFRLGQDKIAKEQHMGAGDQKMNLRRPHLIEIQEEQTEAAAELPEEFMTFVKKLDLVNHSGKRFEVWLTNEQVYDTEGDEVDYNKSFYIELAPGASMKFSTDLEYATKLAKLFESYSTSEEVRKAQLYMQIRAEGENTNFKRVWNIPVYKTGMQGLKLKSLTNKVKSQHFLLHTTRKATYTTVAFESNTVVFNRLRIGVRLSAFVRGKDGKYIRASSTGKIIHDQVFVEAQQVAVVPISWFESEYEVRVSHSDASTTEEESKDRNVVLTNIKKVLNPNITEPYEQLSQQIKLFEDWVAFEVALLQTRSRQIGQFVLTLNYVCKAHNLMFTPIRIMPEFAIKEAEKIEESKKAKAGQQKEGEGSEIFSEQLSGDTDMDEEVGYQLPTDTRQSLPKLNLEKAGSQESSFLLELKLLPGVTYQKKIDYSILQKMSANKTIGFQNGIIVDLVRVSDSASNVRQTQLMQPRSTMGLDQISVVLEKVPRTSTLKNCVYDAFNLRNKLFFHQSSYYIEVYAPLMAVNLTKNTLNIFDKPLKGVSRSEIELPPERNAYLNLHKDIKAKLFMKKQDYQVSEPFSFQEVGMQNIIKMREETGPMKGWSGEQIKQKKESIKKVELATKISPAQAPYEKTKILRIVQRTVLINQLKHKIVFREPLGSGPETVLDVGGSLDYDFFAVNLNNALMVKLAPSGDDDGESKVASQGQHNHSLATSYTTKQLQAVLSQRQHWSYQFNADNIGDFQITLPNQQNAQQPDKSWSNQNRRLFVRVSIRQDQVDDGKLIVVFSHPFEPEFFCINYTNHELEIKQKELSRSDANDEYTLGSVSGYNDPQGLPIVLNPALPKSADELTIALKNQNSRSQTVRIGTNSVHSLQLDDRVQIQVQTRKSGSCWLIEFHKQGAELSANKTCDEEQDTWFDRVSQRAIGYQVKDEKEAKEKGLQKYDITKSLMIVKLAGLGISMVDFNPREICYFSLEGIVYLNESNIYKEDRRQKTFTKTEASIRNCQIDDCLSAVVPIVFGPKQPFRKIERAFRAENGKDKMPIEQHFLRAWVCMSEETDGTINTKTIEDIQVELIELDFNLQVAFLGKLQDLLGSLSKLSSQFGILGSSTIMLNLGIVNKLILWQDPGIQFEQMQLIKSVYEQVSEQNQDDLVNIRKSVNNTLQSQTDGSFLKPDEICKLLDSVKKENLPLAKVVGGQHANGAQAAADDAVMNLNKVFIESMVIKKIVINTSLKIRGIERMLKKRGALGFLINFGSNFGDITGAEFMFEELELAGLNETQETISGQLTQHYKSEAITQFYQVATQQDILGNPGSFIKNLAKAGVEAKSAPFDAFLTSDPKKAGVKGCYGGIKGLVTNTTLAFSTSYSGVSGSLYLGLRNLCNARLTHAEMDRPLSIQGGILKGGKGFGLEVWYGISGLYTVPRKRIKMQGVGAKQIAKGMGQGLLQLVTAPLNAPLRATYNFSSGLKNQLQGHKMQPQRFRHPRYIDNDMRMARYDPVMSHASTALRECRSGKYQNEVISYALDLSYINKADRFIQQVVLITDQSILMISDKMSLIKQIPLRKIRGTMVYYYDHKQGARSIVNMELESGEVVKLKTRQPSRNNEFVTELRRQLEQLEKLDKHNFDDMQARKSRIAARHQSMHMSNQARGAESEYKDVDELNPLKIHNVYDNFSFEEVHEEE